MVETLESEVSRHKCVIYDGDPSQQLPVIVPFLKEGLNANWRCLYLGSPDMVAMVGAALSHTGIDTNREGDRGALLLSADRSHLEGGSFNPKAMIEGLSSLIDDAEEEGFEGLYATGDMSWELGGDSNFELLLEYEAYLEQLFRTRKLRGICQYRRDLLPAGAVQDALITHRSVYIGEALNRDNLYYMPPELLLETRNGGANAKHGEWMCQQILRVIEAEEARDNALADLRDSVAYQRRLAEQLSESNHLLETRVKERTAQLESANRNLEAFSAAVSHDLRTPLRSISGFTRILEEDFGHVLGDDGKEILGRVQAGTLRMDRLIDGLMTLSRISTKEFNQSEVDLSALAYEVVAELQGLDSSRQVEVAIQTDMKAKGDPSLLRSMLTNLIGNAWKFSSKTEAPRIEFGCKPDITGQTVFFVQDNGAGFDGRHAQHLFAAFQRLHKDTEFPGTGIGLATAQRIVTRHGGTIWAESEVGKGATFSFTLD